MVSDVPQPMMFIEPMVTLRFSGYIWFDTKVCKKHGAWTIDILNKVYGGCATRELNT